MVILGGVESDHRYKKRRRRRGSTGLSHTRLGARPGPRLPTVLSFLGALSGRGRDTRPMAEGELPARAALLTWPRPARPVPGCTSMSMVNALTKPCGWPARRCGRAHEEWPKTAPMG